MSQQTKQERIHVQLQPMGSTLEPRTNMPWITQINSNKSRWWLLMRWKLLASDWKSYKKMWSSKATKFISTNSFVVCVCFYYSEHLFRALAPNTISEKQHVYSYSLQVNLKNETNWLQHGSKFKWSSFLFWPEFKLGVTSKDRLHTDWR